MSKFFALIDRMKYIERWGLMRSTVRENVAEHSLEVAMIAHSLALAGNKKFGKNFNADRIAVIALYHESSEVITGDLPAPIKYLNPLIRNAYKDIEYSAVEKLISMLPDEFTADYRDIMLTDAGSAEYKLIKAADKIAALIKCLDELKSGNAEFKEAEKSLAKEIKALDCAEADYFIDTFIGAFSMTLDELSNPG